MAVSTGTGRAAGIATALSLVVLAVGLAVVITNLSQGPSTVGCLLALAGLCGTVFGGLAWASSPRPPQPR